MANLSTIKNWFKTGLKPTQQQFWDTWDSFWHKDESIPVAKIEGIDNLLNQKANKSVVDNHLTDSNAHAEKFSTKEDKSKKGQAGGYAPLDEFVKISPDYLPIVDDLATGGTDKILSAEKGKALKLLIDQKRSISGTQYSYVAGNGTPIENGAELQTAYNAAKNLLGLTSTNRFKIIVGTGSYDFESQFNIDVQFIDIVSLTGNADVLFLSAISVTANDVFLKGLKTNIVFSVSNNLNLLICENCISEGSNSFVSNGIASGTYINCIAGDYSFGAWVNGSATGKFINCKAGGGSFNNASGILINCEAGVGSFIGVASGTFTNCVGGQYSFGNSQPGSLTGKLFYCRLNAGTFISVSNGGRTYYCVDGNGNPNNQ